MVDAHTVATFAFAQMRRDPQFGKQFPWVRNTVVCVESDLADDVLSGQVKNYFPDGGTIACFFPADHRMMFITVDGGKQTADGSEELSPETVVANDKHGKLTIGMLVDAVYRNRGGNWSHLPRYGFGEVSTAEAERHLALSGRT